MENLKNCINNDLANNYGNLCQRVFSFIKKNCNNKIPMKDNLNENDIKLISNIKDNLPYLINLINNQNLNEYIKTVVKFSFEANKYFNDSEPWVFKKRPKKNVCYYFYNSRADKKYIYSFKSNNSYFYKKSFRYNKYFR